MNGEEKQKKPEKIRKLRVRKRGSARKKAALLIAVLLLVLLLGVSAAGWFIKVEKLTVTGNVYTDAAETAQEFFSHDNDMRILVIACRIVFGKFSNPAFEKVNVQYTGLHSAVLEVTETEAVSEIEDDGLYYILNGKGILLRVTDSDQGLTRVTGLTVNESRDLTLLEAEPAEEYESAGKIFTMMQERGMTPTLIEVSDTDYTVSINNARVDLGKFEYIEQKLDALEQQSDYLKDLTGTLHLENYDGTEENGTFWFSVGE